ncbi:hypothetical protein L7F22_000732 [Adiantum nelumboides]|nr:hypothetical protein [Adiantum nelumboides]
MTLDKINQSKKIYFRGHRVWQAVMDDLLALGLKNAEKALLSGCSAGGLASIIHCDNFRSQLPENAVVKCLSDAGFFLDSRDVMNRSFIQSFYRDVVSLHGIAAQLPRYCQEGVKCFFPQYLLKGMKTPLFILNPAYDTWQIENILLPVPEEHLQDWNLCMKDPRECSGDQMKVLQGFRVNMLEALDAVEGSEEGGLFINSCFTHCQSEMDMTWHNARTPEVNQRTIAEAVGDWFFKRRPAKDIDSDEKGEHLSNRVHAVITQNTVLDTDKTYLHKDVCIEIMWGMPFAVCKSFVRACGAANVQCCKLLHSGKWQI